MVRGASVEKAYKGISVIKNCNFEIKKGRILALAGPNGAGKTTLLKMIARITMPDSGSIVFDPDTPRESLGYVPQQNAFFEELTVDENLRYWKRGGAAYEETVSLLELSPVMHTKASNLSGGMQRRLNIAAALINAPRFLIMDEPLTGVDIVTRQGFMRWMLLLKQKGMTILYSTHHTDEIDGIADDLILMRSGEVIFQGSASPKEQSLEEFFNEYFYLKK